MTTTTTDPVAFLTDLLNSLQEYTLESLHDFQDYIGTPKVRHWLRIIVIVAGYILLRPAIEMFFKWWFERKTSKEEEEQKKKKEEEDKQLEAEGLKKPKKDGNSLRVGAKSEAGVEEEKKKEEVVKGKVSEAKSGKKAATSGSETNKKESKVKTDEYENSDQEDFAEKIRASGVLEWGRDARKRKQRQQTEAEQQQQQKKMDEEKLLELLDWSDDERKQ
ncbi:uncharacterized protein BHQ10_003271 [Talaromyces amestolkiae]|uniref:Uncharacterized protein n=1 Tax=Talaromyces amestolkiae TaxID=1196081 RepID=A0A364KUP5_TALAM|nr:uncharacterized protein BHQ10_003271 [Talaromyces amestolkiae]RAO67259.1 hypothetical protein BHQ10_003271 [Talaromyces amestolkiae]